MTDGTHSNSQKEEAWITKYRAAMENAPAEESSAAKIRKAIKNLCRLFISRFTGTKHVEKLRQDQDKASAKSGPALVAQPFGRRATLTSKTQAKASVKTKAQSARKGVTPTTLPATTKREA
jgi:hypothetical protein